MNLLEGKVAIVTGAARGIGEAIVNLFAENGAKVAFSYVSDSSTEKAKAIEDKWNGNGLVVKAYKSNAGDYAASEHFVADVLKDFGTIDILVNNAGISRDNLLMRMGVEQWDEVMETNLRSVFNMTKHVIKTMMKKRSGSIINMTSVIGNMGNAGQSSYAASKAGIVGFTKSIAKELGSRNVRSNAIAPGFVETDMTSYLKDGDAADKYKTLIPLGKFATPADVANAVLFLASDLSTYITGQNINVDGGMNM